MRTIAERLIFRLPAAAQPDGGAAGESKFISVRVMHREIALNSDGTVVKYRNLRCHYPDASRSQACTKNVQAYNEEIMQCSSHFAGELN